MARRLSIDRYASYILVDLERAHPQMVHSMRVNGHEPWLVQQPRPNCAPTFDQTIRVLPLSISLGLIGRAEGALIPFG